MVNADGASVRALASGSRRNAGRIVFRWDGTNDDGALVDDGPYRLRIHFADAHRTILIPNVVRVDTHPPAVEIADIAPRRISPDGDGRRDAARIVFRLSERAQPLLRADGALVLRWKTRAAGAAAIVWRGTASGRPLPAGFYRVTLQSRDLAGNLSATTEAITVRIRYIELALRRPRARSGGLLRFRVLTDARRFRWALLRRASMAHPLASGTARAGAVAVRLPARIGAGRYRLRVTANDHSDGATIVVRTRR